MQPKIRFSDTSYIIHHQWLKGKDKATFPIVYNYSQYKQRQLAEASVRAKVVVTVKEEEPTAEPLNSKKLTRRKSESLERKRNRRGSAHRISISSEDEDTVDNRKTVIPFAAIANDCIDSAQTTASVTTTEPIFSNVTAEIHNRPESKIDDANNLTKDEIITNEPVKEQTKEETEEKDSVVKVKINENSDSVSETKVVDINHNSLPISENSNKNNVQVVNSDVVIDKQFHPISDSSSYDESDEPDSEYATVQLRNRVSFFCYLCVTLKFFTSNKVCVSASV